MLLHLDGPDVLVVTGSPQRDGSSKSHDHTSSQNTVGKQRTPARIYCTSIDDEFKLCGRIWFIDIAKMPYVMNLRWAAFD
jgi:hypothetical protein